MFNANSEYWQALYAKDYSEPLEKYLSSFAISETQEPTADRLCQGVREFIGIANLSPQAREQFYGSKMLGLYFRHNLTQLWNEDHEPSPAILKLTERLSPSSWKHSPKSELLFYIGEEPLSIGLNELIKGPTTIDCGMFCQLSLWMGIRYCLGDNVFNELFKHTAFYITQAFYEDIIRSSSPLENPLYPFLTPFQDSAFQTDVLQIVHIRNDARYLWKHPGGVSQGENCIVIDGQYNIFAPLAPQSKFSDLQALESFLRDAYNLPQDQYDDRELSKYAHYAGSSKEHFFEKDVPLKRYIERAEEYKNHQISEAEWESMAEERKAPAELNLIFDHNKFITWVEKLRAARDAFENMKKNASLEYNDSNHQSLSTLSEKCLQPLPPRSVNITFFNFSTHSPVQRKYKTNWFAVLSIYVKQSKSFC